jgi:hypothetical protein
MKMLVAFCLSFASALLLGQTLSPDQPDTYARNPVPNRLERLPKRFPPDLIVSAKNSHTAIPTRSNCVYHDLAANSLAVKACRTSMLELNLFPALEKIAPTTSPVTRPGDVR